MKKRFPFSLLKGESVDTTSVVPADVPATMVAANPVAAQGNGLKTAELNQNLTNLGARVGSLQSNYQLNGPLGGFAPVFAALLGMIAQAWVDFQNRGCKALTDAYQAFRDAKRFSPEQTNTTFGQKLNAAKTAFLAAVRTSAGNFAARNRERWEALAHAQSELPRIERDLWLHLVKMTGSDQAVVDPVNYEEDHKDFKKWFLIILGIEVALGVFVLELKSNRIFALAVAVASAGAIMFSRHKSSESKALINGYNDSRENYKRSYPGQQYADGSWAVLPGVQDFEGNVVQLYPLSTTVRQTYVKAETTYWLISLSLLTWRAWVSYTDPDAGLIGVFGALLVIAVSSVYGWVRKYPAYQRHLQERWQELVNDKQACSQDIAEFSKPDPEDPYAAEVAAVKEAYFAKATEANREIDSDLESRRQAANHLLEMTAQYMLAFDGCRNTYITLWSQAAGFCKLNPDPTFFSNTHPENTEMADTMFDSYLRPTLCQRDLLDEANTFNPQVVLTAAPATPAELDQLIAQAEQEASVQNPLQAGPTQGILVYRRNQ